MKEHAIRQLNYSFINVSYNIIQHAKAIKLMRPYDIANIVDISLALFEALKLKHDER